MSVNIGLLLITFIILVITIIVIRLASDSSDSEKLKEPDAPNALTEFRKRMGLD